MHGLPSLGMRCLAFICSEADRKGAHRFGMLEAMGKLAALASEAALYCSHESVGVK